MPHVEIPQAEFKVVLLGSSHIGKSSLVTRFSEGYYRDNSRQPTVGASFVTKRIQSSEHVTCKVQIWDTAGQPSFRGMAHMFYKDAAAVIVCYDVGSRRSFQEMRDWLDELRLKLSAGEVVVAIAALKADLIMQQKEARHDDTSFVPEQEVEQLAETLGVFYLPTSAKLDQNVQALFQRVADQVLQNRRNAKIQKKTGDTHHHDGAGTAVNGGEGHRHPPSQQLLESDIISPTNEHGNGKLSPRRSKYDKYQVKQDGDQYQTPTRTLKRETKATAGSNKKKSGAGTPKAKSKRDDTLVEEVDTRMRTSKTDDGMCVCEPVACGAGEGMEGDSGCLVS